MHVEIQSPKFQLPAALAAQAQLGLNHALEQRHASIQRIVLRLGGMARGLERTDTFCLIQVHLADSRVATVIDIGPNAEQVIKRATGRAGRTVLECLRTAA